MSHDVRRDYESAELIVHWDSAKCTHSGRCVRNMPQVFNLQEHPWINLAGATSDEIEAQVGRCPSGALTCTCK